MKTNTWETANTFTFIPIRIPKHIYNLCWQHNDITKKQTFDQLVTWIKCLALPTYVFFPRLWFLSISSLVTVMPHSSQKILQRRTHFHKEMKSKSMCCESTSRSWKRTDWILFHQVTHQSKHQHERENHFPVEFPLKAWDATTATSPPNASFSPLSSTGKVLQTGVWKLLRRSVKSKVTGWGRVRGAKQNDAFSPQNGPIFGWRGLEPRNLK